MRDEIRVIMSEHLVIVNDNSVSSNGNKKSLSQDVSKVKIFNNGIMYDDQHRTNHCIASPNSNDSRATIWSKTITFVWLGVQKSSQHNHIGGCRVAGF